MDEVAAAEDVARSAAARAGVEVRDVHDHAAMTAVSSLFDAVWGRPATSGAILAPEALTALDHAGGQVSVARRGGELVGATAAFLGLDDGELLLHSHVTGVAPADGGRGIGQALKWHQRAWCLARGVERVRWTFDPLVRRNAVLNLVVLGARAVSYQRDRYGSMRDARNAGLPTDRLVVEWELTSPRTAAAAAGRAAVPEVSALRRTGAEVALEVGPDEGPHLRATDAPRRLVQVPADIEGLRERDRDLAAAWAAAVRAALGDRLAGGDRISGATRDGWYVVTADRDVAELARTDVGGRP